MSKVTQVTVRYGRSVQPKPYESKEGMMEAVVVADEGESVTQQQLTAVMSSLIYDVHAALDLPMVAVGVANSPDEPPKKTRKTRAKKGEKTAAASDEAPVEGDIIDGATVEVEGVEVVTEGVSDQELQSAAAAAAAKHGAAKVKDLMKEFDVILLGKLDQPKRLEFLSKLDALDA